MYILYNDAILLYIVQNAACLKFLIMGDASYVASARLHRAKKQISLVLNYKYVQERKSL